MLVLAAPDAAGQLWSSQIELWLGVHEGKLRLFTREGELLPAGKELLEQAASAEQRTASAEQRVASADGEQRARSSKQRARSSKQRARSSGRRFWPASSASSGSIPTR